MAGRRTQYHNVASSWSQANPAEVFRGRRTTIARKLEELSQTTGCASITFLFHRGKYSSIVAGSHTWPGDMDDLNEHVTEIVRVTSNANIPPHLSIRPEAVHVKSHTLPALLEIHSPDQGDLTDMGLFSVSSPLTMNPPSEVSRKRSHEDGGSVLEEEVDEECKEQLTLIPRKRRKNRAS